MGHRCLSCGRRRLSGAPPCENTSCPAVEPAAESPIEEQAGTPVPPPVIPGYHMGEPLGHGGYGAVHTAVREHDGQLVAIKVFYRQTSAARERVQVEAEALRVIGPPFVPVLYETGTLDDGAMYMVCEHVDLPNLGVKLAEWSAPLEPDRFLPLADVMLKALEATHARGFVHRDIKPENFLIAEAPPTARLIDFGIAKASSALVDTVTQTATGMALGTPDYMSPEQCAGRSDIDHRADIYSVGVLFYELLTARPPFFGSAAEVHEAHVVRRPAPPSRVADIAPLFDEVLLRCLAKAPGRRWRSARDLRRALWRAGKQGRRLPSEATPPPRAQTASGYRAPSSQRLPVGIVFFEASTATGTIKHALSALGGQLMGVRGRRCVAIFGLDASGNPVLRAYEGARALIAQDVCEQALVDRDRVRVRIRADGARRLFSAASLRQDRFPLPEDPPGVLLSAEAAEALPELRTETVRSGIEREREASAAGETTDATALVAGLGPLVGREPLLEQLLDSARKAVKESLPTIATVISEPGYGKTHLCAAIQRELDATVPEVELLSLRAREPMGGESPETLGALLRAVLELPEDVPPDSGQGLLTSLLGQEVGAEVWPAAALALGWIAADAPAVRRLSAAPAALRSAATRAVGEALRRRAHAQPLCCIIDDAHFADDISLDAIEYATLAEAGAPLWVCVMVWPSFERARPSWGKRTGRFESMRLSPLSRDSARELCRMLLQPATNISRATLNRLAQQTQGNPLLLVELVRGIKRHGLIRRHARGDSWYLATDELDKLPDLPGVEWLAERELAALPPELAAHAQLVSLLGADFSTAELEGILGELEADGLGEDFPLDGQVSVRRLLAHGLALRHRDGSYGFRHQLIREHVANTTPDPLRTRIHEACFRYYRDAVSMPAPRRLPRLALHAAQSGANAIASELYLDLADNASIRHSYVEAESMYSRALALLAASDQQNRMSAFSGRGSMRYRLSRFEDAMDDLGRARAIAHELRDTVNEVALLLDIATGVDWTRDFVQSERVVEEALALAPAERPPLIDARLSMSRGRASFRLQQWDKAHELLEQAIAQAETVGDSGYETLVISLVLMGVLAAHEKNLELAKTTFDRAIVLCEERGDKLHLASALNNRRDIWLAQKSVDRAAIDGLRCQQIAREIGQSEIEFVTTFNLAELYYYAGDLEASWPHLRRAVEMEPSNASKPMSLLLQARLLAFADRRMAARSVLESIRESQDRSRAMGNMDALFIESEEVLYTMVELTTRETISGEWNQLRAQAERVCRNEELAEVIEMMGLVTLRRGRPAQARTLFENALAVCEVAPHLIEERIRRQLNAGHL